MNSPRFFTAQFLSFLLLAAGITFVPAATAQPPKQQKQENAPPSAGAEERLLPRHRKTAKEKEYAELARKIRESDGEFEKTWRSTKAQERQKLRSERLEKLQPTLARMNQLAREIRLERTGLSGESAPSPVPVSGALTIPDEIKGKTESELRQLGIAVGKLHQKQESSTADVQPGKTGGK